MKRHMTLCLALITFCLSACGGGGGGSSSGVVAGGGSQPTRATLSISTSGTLSSGATLSGIGITVTLPAGVTVVTDTGGNVGASVVYVSGVSVPGTVASPLYTAATASAPATLSFVVASSTASGFGTGEFATVNCIIAQGTSPQATDFSLSGFTPSDLSLKPVTGLSASFTALIQ